MMGDRVTIELSPDGTRGRIIFRGWRYELRLKKSAVTVKLSEERAKFFVFARIKNINKDKVNFNIYGANFRDSYPR